jgi:predicted RNA-binding Zn-ribbon protein involved in translation (DUF1610 family)
MSRMDKSGKKDGTNGLIAAVRQLEQAKQQARALGIFTDDRELLECPNCGLLEDVTTEGLLVTYPNTSEEVNDSSLRFIPADESSFICPSCGTKVKAVIL